MRFVTFAVLTAGTIALATPALAEDVIVGGRVGGVGVDVGHHHHDRTIVTNGYAHARCKTVIIHKEGVTKKIRRCD